MGTDHGQPDSVAPEDLRLPELLAREPLPSQVCVSRPKSGESANSLSAVPWPEAKEANG